jgi:hypothetical protein
MFAAEELALEFWAFVRYRAFDEHNEYTFSRALTEQDDARRNRAIYLQPGDERIESRGAFDSASSEPVRAPVVYRTLQEALVDFLIDEIGTNKVPDFADWLRAQAVIMAQAAREPEWLIVKTPVIDENGQWSPDSLTTHTMAVGPGPWDVLSRETFDVLVQHFFGAQDGHPLRNREIKRLMSEAP